MSPVETRKTEVEESKEMAEVWDAFEKIFKASKDALADGWQPGQDLPAIAMVAYTALPIAIAGLNKIPAEYREKRLAFLNANAIGSAKLMDAVLPAPKAV